MTAGCHSGGSFDGPMCVEISTLSFAQSTFSAPVESFFTRHKGMLADIFAGKTLSEAAY